MRASLGLDGELSQVEQALVRAHVGRCASCAGFVLELGGLTQEIRETPLVRPLRTAVPARRRRRGTRSLQVCAAALAVAVAAGLGGLAGSLTSGKPAAQGVKAAHLTARSSPSDVVSRFVAQLPGDHARIREPI
jgi:predicted anti-sigma-YlaC factor YlaD